MPEPAPLPAPLIEIRNLSLAYGRHRVTEGLSLRLGPGFTTLVGPNGCGKSTVLKALAGLHAPTAGQILLDGGELSRIGRRGAARRIGMLAQVQAAPDGLSVADLVRQGRYPHRAIWGGWRDADEAAVARGLALTGMDNLADRPLAALSGGQRQRAWIAMVLAQDTGIILLDEPTTYLDLRHQVEILELMRRLVDEGRTMVIAVLHDLGQAARYSDRMILLRDGQTLADGPPSEVVRPDLLERGFDLRARVIPDPDTGAPVILPGGMTG